VILMINVVCMAANPRQPSVPGRIVSYSARDRVLLRPTATLRFGHRIKNAGNLPALSARFYGERRALWLPFNTQVLPMPDHFAQPGGFLDFDVALLQANHGFFLEF
jgi:hypothetical protein